MTSTGIFNLDLSRIDVLLLTILPAAINLAIYTYVSASFHKSRITSFFSLFALFMAIWQFTEGLVRLSITVEWAARWNKVSEIAILFVIFFGIKFITHLTLQSKTLFFRVLSFFLFVPLVLFTAIIILDFTHYFILPSDRWYWLANPEPSFAISLIFTGLSAGGLLMLGLLLFSFVTHKKDEALRKKVLLLLTGAAIPVFGGIIFEVILPLVFGLDDIPVTCTLITSFSLAAFIAIKRHKMLDFSPRHQWEDIIEQIEEGILIVDNHDKIMYANRSFCDKLGYHFPEIQGKCAANLFLEPRDSTEMGKIIEQRKNKLTGKYLKSVKTKNGEKLWMRISGMPYINRRGEVIGSIGIHTDITDLKKYQHSIEYSENRLKQAQSVAHLGSWELNFSTKKAIWSDEACNIYGLCPSKKNDQSFESWLEFVHPEDKMMVQREIKRSQSSLSKFSLKHRILRKDGSVRYINTLSQFEFNDAGFPTGLFGICFDVTEQVEAEKALNESEIRMRNFINESLLAIYFIDPVTKKVLYANSAFLELLGYEPADLESITVYDFITHSKEDIDQRVAETIKNKKIDNGERVWKRKDGKTIYVLVSSVFQKNETEMIYVAAQDITERKKAEEQLLELNKELETFIYKAGHDIRGPLASILGLVEVSFLDLKEKKSLQYMKMIGSATEKLDYTLSELVKAMQIKNVQSFEDNVDFNSLIPGILNKYSHYPGYASMKISIDVNYGGPFNSNNSILETILQNLVENSIKYRNTSIPDPFINIKVFESEGNVMIVVNDNGMGIEKSIQKNVFDMYFRGTQSPNGSGLGLYLVRKGIEKLKGEITLTSEPGEGTTFTIRLPMDYVMLKVA